MRLYFIFLAFCVLNQKIEEIASICSLRGLGKIKLGKLVSEVLVDLKQVFKQNEYKNDLPTSDMITKTVKFKAFEEKEDKRQIALTEVHFSVFDKSYFVDTFRFSLEAVGGPSPFCQYDLDSEYVYIGRELFEYSDTCYIFTQFEKDISKDLRKTNIDYKHHYMAKRPLIPFVDSFTLEIEVPSKRNTEEGSLTVKRLRKEAFDPVKLNAMILYGKSNKGQVVKECQMDSEFIYLSSQISMSGLSDKINSDKFSGGFLSKSKKLFFYEELFACVETLHKNNMVHGQIRTVNFFLDRKGFPYFVEFEKAVAEGSMRGEKERKNRRSPVHYFNVTHMELSDDLSSLVVLIVGLESEFGGLVWQYYPNQISKRALPVNCYESPRSDFCWDVFEKIVVSVLGPVYGPDNRNYILLEKLDKKTGERINESENRVEELSFTSLMLFLLRRTKEYSANHVREIIKSMYFKNLKKPKF